MISSLRKFYRSLGLVEQAQVVTSTAVVVMLITVITANLAIGKALEWMDFISIVTMGVFGFVTVFFSLKYGRQLEAQRHELLALNSIAEAVNHSVELNYVLHSALVKVMELMKADCGWIYLVENQSLSLKHYYGTTAKFFPNDFAITDSSAAWIRKPNIHRVDDARIELTTTMEFKVERVQILASLPLERQGNLAGVLIIGGKDARRFVANKIALLQAFGNQISAALQNASLFEQLRKSERLYADLFEHSPDMYHSVNRAGMIVSCNVTESEVLGMPKEQIVGRPLETLYPVDHRLDVKSNLRRIFEEKEELRGVEEKIQRADGTLIDVSMNTSIVYGPDGSPKLARMVLRDITDQKRIEAKLLQAQKIDSIGNLAGGIAHDFNNILTSILGSASIMHRKTKDDPRWQKYVELIETASRRGAALTRQLLTFARKNNPNIQRVDMNKVIDETIHLFEATTPKSIHINKILAEEPVVVRADEGQLQQAILNLCLNARDAMPKGGVMRIQCKAIHITPDHAKQFAEGKPGDYVMVSVIDSGSGIPPNVLNRIFEPFFTTKEQGKGTGLGLAVTYGVVRSHDGYINVESEVNSGTMFTVYLPRVMEAGIAAVKPQETSDLPRGKEHVLLLEDEIAVSEVGIEILTDLGYRVELARNGREAIDLLQKSAPFDIVILDMNMPRMGGRESFDYIKQNYPGTKILVCSGYSAAMIDDGKFVQSIEGFIQKPYEVDDFARKIRDILDGRPQETLGGGKP
jgi:PAS domain S-box-containing protein